MQTNSMLSNQCFDVSQQVYWMLAVAATQGVSRVGSSSVWTQTVKKLCQPSVVPAARPARMSALHWVVTNQAAEPKLFSSSLFTRASTASRPASPPAAFAFATASAPATAVAYFSTNGGMAITKRR